MALEQRITASAALLRFVHLDTEIDAGSYFRNL